MNLYVECCKSKDKDTLYHVLKCDFGYRVAVISMEKDIICEMANIRMSDLYKLKAGDIVKVGQVVAIAK